MNVDRLVRFWCDDGSHWKKRRLVASVSRSRYGEWIAAFDDQEGLEIEVLEGDEISSGGAWEGVVRSGRRRRFRLRCKWCGDRSVVVARDVTLKQVLDDATEVASDPTPRREPVHLTLVDLAAKLRSSELNS